MQLQSYPTPCDPMDCSPPGSSVQWVPEGNCLTSPNLGCLICKMEIIMITIIIRIRIITYINYVAHDRPKLFISFPFLSHSVSSVHFSHSVMSNSLRSHESQHTRPPCPSPNSWSSLKLTSIESVMPSSHLILCRPLLLLPPISPSIRVSSKESALCIRWPKYWSFSFSHQSF